MLVYDGLRYFLLSLFILLTSFACFPQEEETRFTDFVIHKNSIWTLDSKGRVNSFFLEDEMNSADFQEVLDSVDYITSDRLSNPILVQKSGATFRYQSIDESELITSKISPFYKLTFDRHNECYIIAPEGVKKMNDKRFKFPKKWHNGQINYKKFWFRYPQVYTDEKDRIWIGFAYGEWGGELFIYDINEGKFHLPEYGDFRITLNPVKSIFGEGENVYASFGLMHFDASGALVRFNDLKCEMIFESESKGNPFFKDTVNPYLPAEYIGPGDYSGETNSIYFYSQNGFFRAIDNDDLNDISKWTNIVKPSLHWNSGQPDAVGSPMNVMKFKLIDENRFVFLSQLDGIGYYNGKSIQYIEVIE